MPPTRVLHIITGLEVGGAEMMLAKLLSAMDRDQFPSQVISLTSDGPIGERIRALGIETRALGLPATPSLPLAPIRLARWVREARPDVVQTWMYLADVIGGCAARAVTRAPVVWGVRQTVHGELTRASSAARRASVSLSRMVPTRIVCCSDRAASAHARLGYVEAKLRVIPNGFDTTRFAPDSGAFRSVRQELGLPVKTRLVGMSARFQPQKNHRSFVRTAAILTTAVPDCHFVLWGQGCDWSNAELGNWVRSAGLDHRFHLLGLRYDVERLTAALDVATLSSDAEGFPNVIGEAMACAVPCVVTDVGDSAAIVGDTGRVVPPRDPGALATAWHEMLNLSPQARRELGTRARARIAERYSLGAIARRYQDLYRGVVRQKAGQD